MFDSSLIITRADIIDEYRKDESRLTGKADSISFPENAEEIREVLTYITDNNIPCTVQGGRTGITGGAVPERGHILNLGRMNRIEGLRYSKESDRDLTAGCSYERSIDNKDVQYRYSISHTPAADNRKRFSLTIIVKPCRDRRTMFMRCDDNNS